MICLEPVELEQYLAGELNDPAAQMVRRHIGSCDACRHLLEDVSANLQLEGSLRSVMAKQAAPDMERPPTAMAGYEIIRELGRGGMGIVYEARQCNPRRVIALKVLNVARAGDEHSRLLFRREAAALARLSHPGVAAIHDAGATPDGRPFFAMELVDGRRLDAFARRGDLTIAARVRLFQAVCDAVAAAHQRGVIHRDLKPSNILVDAQGRPKVLDFGLARILEPNAESNDSMSLSLAGRIVGTIPYMSPEQVRGDGHAIDVRSDVYSLGVILYQLLTDRLPYPIEGKSLTDAAHVIAESAPQRPSAIHAALRGDLETIVLQSLAKDPARRYQSVTALRDDLERCLTSQPILARSPTLGYQLGKLIGRHKAPFAAAAVAALLLGALGVRLAITAARLEAQRADAVRAQQDEAAARVEADRQARIAREINTFLNDMLNAASPDQGGAARDTKVIDVLADAAQSLATSFPDQPEVAAALYFTLGDTYRALSELSTAEQHLRTALEIRQRLHPGDHEDIAQSMNKLARVLEARGDYASAESLFVESLAMRRRLFGEEHVDVANSLNNLGVLMTSKGDLNQAESLHREALATRLHLLGEEHGSVASSLNNFSLVLSKRGKLDEAEALLRRSLDIDLKLRGERHPNVATTMNNLAYMLHRRGRHAEAESMFRRILDLKRSIVGPSHVDVALGLHNLAWCLSQQNRFEEAEPLYREALALYRATVGDDSPDTARTLDHLGHVRQKRGELAEAETLLREALAIRRACLPIGHRDILISTIGLGLTLQEQGRFEEAESLLLEAHQQIEAATAFSPRDRIMSLERMTRLYEAWGRADRLDQCRRELAALRSVEAK